MIHFVNHKVFKTTLNVDCIRKCPYDDHLLAMAHYQQILGEDVLGGLSLYNYKTFIDFICRDQMQFLETVPILHICWLQKLIQGKMVIVASCRDSTIRIYTYDTQLFEVKCLKPSEKGFLLYCDAYIQQNRITIVASSDQSKVYYIILDAQFEIVLNKTFQKHDYAVWCCRLNPFNLNVFASGDQLNNFNIYDHRVNNSLILTNNKTHQAGISDILFHSTLENILMTGCFSGYMKWFDMRKFNCEFKSYKSQSEKKENIQRGVLWRISIDVHQKYTDYLLNISSNKLYQILREDNYEVKKLSEINQIHTSLTYSADWNQEVIITSSFYDKVVCVWDRKL